MNKAVGVLNGAAAAGKSVANDFMSATNRVVDAATNAANAPASGTTGATGNATPGSAGGTSSTSGTGSDAGT